MPHACKKYMYYNWSKLKKVDFLGSENEFYFGTEGVYKSSVENILTIKFVSVRLVSLDIIMASKISTLMDTLMDQCKASQSYSIHK